MIDDDLRRLVSVDPPAGFAARVRLRVAAGAAADASPSWRRLAWPRPRLLAASGVAAAAALLAIVLFVPRAPVDDATSAPILPSAPVSATAPLASAAVAEVTATAAREPHAAPPRVSRHAVVATGASHAVLQLDAAEMAALQALFRSPPAVALPPVPVDLEIVIEEISIAPLPDLSTQGVPR